MLEARIERFKQDVETTNKKVPNPLISIDRVLKAKEYFPNSSEQDNWYVVGDREVYPYCQFGEESSIQMRMGLYHHNGNHVLVVERGWEGITRSFGNIKDALEAYYLVSSYFLNKYLGPRSSEVKFNRNIRQIKVDKDEIKIEYHKPVKIKEGIVPEIREDKAA